jgi:hypothetical protein
MVTKTEMASCSEDSDDADADGKKIESKAETETSKASPKKVDVVSAKKPVPATSTCSGGKVKQASIMNFFTKK